MEIRTNMVNLNVEALDKALKKIGMPKGKISKLVLNRDQSYISNSMTKAVPTMNESDVRKLCEFLDVKMEDVTIKKTEAPVSTTADTSSSLNLDTLIVGLNVIYEVQKANNEIMSQILEQIKVSNTKINRLENALGQILTNTIQIKDKDDDIYKEAKEIKSSTAIINGRVRDIMNKVNKEG